MSVFNHDLHRDVLLIINVVKISGDLTPGEVGIITVFAVLTALNFACCQLYFLSAVPSDQITIENINYSSFDHYQVSAFKVSSLTFQITSGFGSPQKEI